MNIALFIALLVTFSTVTSLLTEACKKLLDNTNITYCSNILAVIIACIVGIFGTGIYYILFGINFDLANIVCMPLMGLATAVGSMVGYDKVIQTIKQIKVQNEVDNAEIVA